MFVSPRLTAEENRALYDEAYFNGAGFDDSVNYVLLDQEAHTREGENAGVLAKIALHTARRDIRVLDVGCGTGCLVRALLAAGYTDVWGLELSAYAASIAAKSAGAKVLVGDLLDAGLPEGSFDVINATEVIEHLRDPMASFRRIKELLAPGGVFIYSTGNSRGLYARVLGKRWPYIHPEGHLFYFSPETLTRYFREVGLTSVPFTSLDRASQRAFLDAEDQMSHSMLLYIGASDRGVRGRIFRAVGAMESSLVQRAVTHVVGKHQLPMARNPG
jgi:2-polyprenyl-3-methyl-5-hydroxy-6-metoxy-1,4-benzoquinol methylase